MRAAGLKQAVDILSTHDRTKGQRLLTVLYYVPYVYGTVRSTVTVFVLFRYYSGSGSHKVLERLVNSVLGGMHAFTVVTT